MIESESETHIDAPPEAVFDFIAAGKNHEKFMPSLVEVSDVEDTDVGIRGRYVFEMVGQTMEGQFDDTEFDRPNRRAYELTGDIEGTVTWTVENSDGGTRLHYHHEADIPGPDLLETVTDPVAGTYLQREVDSMVENVKMLVEENAARTA
ncbi:MAG: SRPBCC family protein [Salinirussus sp.]